MEIGSRWDSDFMIEPTIDQALQKAVEAHQSRNLVKAESLYRYILKIDPKHSHSNHNLGVMAMNVKQTEVALAHFSVALKSNPKVEQFWLSYIEANITCLNLGSAVHLIEQGRSYGVKEGKLEELEKKILLISDRQISNQNDINAFLKIWIKTHSHQGNVHLSKYEANLEKIPFNEQKAYLRPSTSDVARVSEYLSSIYAKPSYLHQYLVANQPTCLIDIGANIGLSSLSLVKTFPSLRKILAIEAEEQNFGMLQANFDLWKADFPATDWNAVHGVATYSDKVDIFKTEGLFELKKGHSASGTFKYTTDESASKQEKYHHKNISLKKLCDGIPLHEKIIVKLDIEGGEEHLFNSNTEWLSRCHFMTCEVHDAFHPEMMYSSSNMLAALVEHDFAIFPADNVLHCYNRKFI